MHSNILLINIKFLNRIMKVDEDAGCVTFCRKKVNISTPVIFIIVFLCNLTGSLSLSNLILTNIINASQKYTLPLRQVKPTLFFFFSRQNVTSAEDDSVNDTEKK